VPKKGIGRIPAKAAGYDNPPSAARAAATPFLKGGFWGSCKLKGSFGKGAVAVGD